MDNQRIKGAAQRLKGMVKVAVGRLTGNNRLQVSGEVDKVTGSARTTVGRTKDAIRDHTESH